MRLDEYQRTYEYAEAASRALALQAWWKTTPWNHAPSAPCTNIQPGDAVWLRGGRNPLQVIDRKPTFMAQLGYVTRWILVVGGEQQNRVTPYERPDRTPRNRRWWGVSYEWSGAIGGHHYTKQHAEFQDDHFVWVPQMAQLVSFIEDVNDVRAMFKTTDPRVVFSTLLEAADSAVRRRG